MADVPHYCTGCGEVHGGGSGDSPDVKIAKINADRDIEVARIQRSEARQAIEAETEQTETIAAAEVEQTAIEAEAIAEAGIPEPEPEMPVIEAPVVVQAPEEPAGEVSAPPETETGPPVEIKRPSMWSTYR